MHWPAELIEPCSWYCHRDTTGGVQHEPADVLHATGAGSAAEAGAAASGLTCKAGPAQAGAATAERRTTAPASEPNARAPRICDLPRQLSSWRSVGWLPLGCGGRPGIVRSPPDLSGS